MPTTTQQSLPMTSAQSLPALPASLERALADPLAFGNVEGMPWTLPERMPSPNDLRTGRKILDELLKPASEKQMQFFLGQLLVTFGVKQTKAEGELRYQAWEEVNGDLPYDLWKQGTHELMKGHEFGMPNPPHLRALVIDKFQRRQTQLRRIMQMLDAGKPKPEERPKESRDQRVRGMRDAFLKHGMPMRAAPYEIELAKIECREPEAWALAPPAPEATAPRNDNVVVLKPSPRNQALLLRSAARFHKGTDYADDLHERADYLASLGRRAMITVDEVKASIEAERERVRLAIVAALADGKTATTAELRKLFPDYDTEKHRRSIFANRIAWLESSGVIERAGSLQVSIHQYPSTVWKLRAAT